MRKWLNLIVAIIIAVISMSVVSCSDDDKEPGSSEICGVWKMNGNIPGEGDYESSMTFKGNGTCIISEINKTNPSYSYAVTVKYSVSGNLSNGATLRIWGKAVDGDNVDYTYEATISGETLRLKGINGEVDGDVLVLTYAGKA